MLIENDDRIDHVGLCLTDDVGDGFDLRWTIDALLSLLVDGRDEIGLVDVDVLGENHVGLLVFHEGDAFRWFA